MKKIGVFLTLVSLLINCHESKEHLHRFRFSKNTGERIPTEVARRWVARSRAADNSSKTQNFSLSASTLRYMLTPSTQKLGVLLYHATDDNGQHRILFVPVEEYQPMWSSEITMDVNGESIPTSTANAWVEKYKTENVQSIWAHFYGINVFDEILSNEDFEQIDFVPAIADNGKPQVLLYVWTNIVSNGRVNGEELTVYDKSMDCPPCGDI